jgi:hypothetical protein
MHTAIAKIQIIDGIHLVKPSVAFKVPVEIISPAIAIASSIYACVKVIISYTF